MADYLRRKQAGAYLQKKYGFGSASTLAKLATTGGGPRYAKAGEQVVIYLPANLDEWARNQIGAAQSSTSDGPTRRASPCRRSPGRPRKADLAPIASD
jgi:hypothetical protein